MTDSERCYCALRHIRHELEGTDGELRLLDTEIEALGLKIDNLRNRARRSADPFSGEIDQIADQLRELEDQRHALVIKRLDVWQFVRAWEADLEEMKTRYGRTSA